MAAREFIGGVLAEALFSLGRKAYAFSRKYTVAQQRAQLLAWDKPHILLMDGSCCVCTRTDLDDPTAKCPGPPIKGYRT